MSTDNDRFPAFLRYLVEHRGYVPSEMAAASGLYKSDISNLSSGQRTCGVRAFEKIVKAIKDEDKPEAYKAWIFDQIPDAVGKWIQITKATPSLVQDEAYVTPHTVEGALRILTRQADLNPALGQVLMSLAATYAPPPPKG